MQPKYEIGDLVKLRDPADSDRDMGIVTGVGQTAHLVSHGKTNIVQVYWVKLEESDWGYDFFLMKYEEPDLTKMKK